MTLQLGSHGPLVSAWTQVMLKRFRSYALGVDGQPLRDDGYYGFDEQKVQREYERRTNQAQDGIVSDHDLEQLGLQAPDTKPLLITVNGAGVPWWVGPDADTARACLGKYAWQPTGYPGAVFPMGPSIDDAKAELRVQFNRAEPGFMHRQRIEQFGVAAAVYSEGSVAWSEVYRDDILAENGQLHWALPHLKKVVTWGFPQRQFGKVWPDNGGSPMASLTSGGVDSTRMTVTPDWWRNYAHKGDLYAATEPGPAAEDKNAVWQVIRSVDFFHGPDSLLSQVIELLYPTLSLPRIIGAFTALWDAGMFIGKQTGPHVNYGIQPAIDYLLAA
jgi:hypothetical protein